MKMELPVKDEMQKIAPPVLPGSLQSTHTIVTQVKSNRVVYFTDDPEYVPPMDGDWNYVTYFQGELPREMSLRNCWRWRFNGGVFMDTKPKGPAAAPKQPLVEHNRKALLQILNEKIDLVRAQHAPTCIMGALVREEKLREARAYEADEKTAIGYPLLEAVAVARNISLADATRLVIDKAAETRITLLETEQARERFSRAILGANSGEELLSIREELMDQVYPRLTEKFAFKIERTEPLDPSRPLSETHLRHEQTRLQVQLRDAINAKRSICVSQYTLDDVIFKYKGTLAERVLLTKGERPDGVDLSLLENYARARGVSLLNASRDVLRELSEMGRILAETEKLKDSLLAEIARVRTLRDIHHVSTKISSVPTFSEENALDRRFWRL